MLSIGFERVKKEKRIGDRATDWLNEQCLASNSNQCGTIQSHCTLSSTHTYSSYYKTTTRTHKTKSHTKLHFFSGFFWDSEISMFISSRDYIKETKKFSVDRERTECINRNHESCKRIKNRMYNQGDAQKGNNDQNHRTYYPIRRKQRRMRRKSVKFTHRTESQIEFKLINHAIYIVSVSKFMWSPLGGLWIEAFQQ